MSLGAGCSGNDPINNDGVDATAKADIDLTRGTVTKITVINPGSGYTEVPEVTIDGGGGSGATAIARISNGSVSKIDVVDKGSGYKSSPNVNISNSNKNKGDGNNGQIDSVNIKKGTYTEKDLYSATKGWQFVGGNINIYGDFNGVKKITFSNDGTFYEEWQGGAALGKYKVINKNYLFLCGEADDITNPQFGSYTYMFGIAKNVAVSGGKANILSVYVLDEKTGKYECASYMEIGSLH